MVLTGVKIAGFLVVTNREYYLIYKDGEFVLSCDCGELSVIIEELLKETE